MLWTATKRKKQSETLRDLIMVIIFFFFQSWEKIKFHDFFWFFRTTSFQPEANHYYNPDEEVSKYITNCWERDEENKNRDFIIENSPLSFCTISIFIRKMRQKNWRTKRKTPRCSNYSINKSIKPTVKLVLSESVLYVIDPPTCILSSGRSVFSDNISRAYTSG